MNQYKAPIAPKESTPKLLKWEIIYLVFVAVSVIGSLVVAYFPDYGFGWARNRPINLISNVVLFVVGLLGVIGLYKEQNSSRFGITSLTLTWIGVHLEWIQARISKFIEEPFYPPIGVLWTDDNPQVALLKKAELLSSRVTWFAFFLILILLVIAGILAIVGFSKDKTKLFSISGILLIVAVPAAVFIFFLVVPGASP